MGGAGELLGLGVIASIRTGNRPKPKQFSWGDAEGDWNLAGVRYIEQGPSEKMENSYVSFEEMVRRERAGERRHLEELRREQERRSEEVSI